MGIEKGLDKYSWLPSSSKLQYIATPLLTGALLLGYADYADAHKKLNRTKVVRRYVQQTPSFLSGKTLDEIANSYVVKHKRLGHDVALVVKDINSGKRLISINSDKPMQMASLLKPLVALSYFQLVKEGVFNYETDFKAKDRLEASLKLSNNTLTNEVIDWLGGPKNIEEILRNNFPHIFKKISIVQKIPPLGKEYLNTASANDYVRLLEELWHRKLPYSDELLRLMDVKAPLRYHLERHEDDFGLTIPRIRPEKNPRLLPNYVKLYEKNGSTAGLFAGIGIEDDGNPKIIVAIIQPKKKVKDYHNWTSRMANDMRRFFGGINKFYRRYN